MSNSPTHSRAFILVDKLAKLCYTTHMKLEIVAKHTALFCTLVGALFTALAWDPMNIWFLNLGAILYLYWSYTVRDWNLVAVNGGLLTIYVIGAIIRIS